MDSERRLDLIVRNLEEVLTVDELRWMLQNGVPLKHYIGFEISGKVHLGTGFITGFKIRDFQEAGVKCSCYLATWHAWINNKFGGDLETIRKASKYFHALLSKSIDATGGDSSKVKFIDGDKLYHNNDDYWKSFVEITKNTSVGRAMRSITIMGRKEGSEVPLSGLIYAPMQAADIFNLGINVAHSGIDQRKAHVIARDVALKLKVVSLKHEGKAYKPLAMHHHLLMGLKKPPVWPPTKETLSEAKMSKSIPGSAVFVDDSEKDIKENILDAFCPTDYIEINPILDWVKHIVFNSGKGKLRIEREGKFGGDLDYFNLSDLVRDYSSGKLHPLDLKKGVAEYITKLLLPIRKMAAQQKYKKMKDEFDKLSVTR